MPRKSKKKPLPSCRFENSHCKIKIWDHSEEEIPYCKFRFQFWHTPPIPQRRPIFRRFGPPIDPSSGHKKEHQKMVNDAIGMHDLSKLKKAKYLDVDCKYFYFIPVCVARYGTAGRMRRHLTPRTKRPDIDNLIKFTLDSLSPFIRDDSAVYKIHGEKYWHAFQHASEIVIKAYPDLPKDIDLYAIPDIQDFDLTGLTGRRDLPGHEGLIRTPKFPKILPNELLDKQDVPPEWLRAIKVSRLLKNRSKKGL